MTQKLIFVLISTLSSILIYGQDLPTDLKKYAVQITKVDSLNKNIYNLLDNYKVILLGEIHGTNEPVNFLEALVDIFTKNGDSVQVGFEIPSKQMTSFLKHPTKGDILKTDFFSSPSGDGRASLAWYKALASISENHKASLFFFDKNVGDNRNADSVMYLNIKSKIKKHHNWKTITISGDLHSKLLEENGQSRIGSLLIQDKDLNIANKICSINHIFKGGQTLWNEFEETESIYSKLEYDNYLFLYPKNTNEPYSGFLYTKYLTKSESAISK